MITDEERAWVQAVECPLCHAKPGTNCINIGGGGRFTGFIHRERKAVARDRRWHAAWTEQDCPDNAPDGTCWDCGAARRETHRPGCPTQSDSL